eukprot:3221432-Prorocentrum_lima.AAC.1
MIEWEAEWAGFWDTAVRGSSALRAALVRRLAWEVAVAGGKDVVQVFFDAEKFYDNIDPQKLAELGIERDYP